MEPKAFSSLARTRCRHKKACTQSSADTASCETSPSPIFAFPRSEAIMGAAEDITGAAAAGFDCFRPEWGRGGAVGDNAPLVSKPFPIIFQNREVRSLE